MKHRAGKQIFCDPRSLTTEELNRALPLSLDNYEAMRRAPYFSDEPIHHAPNL